MFRGIIYWDDFVELWIKLNQRGLQFILSKFSILGKNRTISSFTADFEHSNWWIIPLLKKRNNIFISGNTEITYEQYITEKYLENQESKVLISLGCGAGNHEIKLAELNHKLTVRGYDFSKDLIISANEKVSVKHYNNAEFYVADVYALEFENESVDYFLFNASLHHFREISNFIKKKIYPALKKNGLIIIHEYVGPNRMQFPDEQMKYCNRCLNEIFSKENTKILLLNKFKTRCYRTGKLRMIISDPSECVDSQNIIPVLRKTFKELEFKKLGGSILMPVLKHIAHHFVEKNQDQLTKLIHMEDKYLETHEADFAFAIYQKS